MTDAGFDLETYRRERVRALEKRVAWLEAYRTRLEVSLAVALECAVQKSALDPSDLLEVIEPVATQVQKQRVALRQIRNLLPALLGPTRELPEDPGDEPEYFPPDPGDEPPLQEGECVA